MIPYEPHPVLFELGPLTLYTYGLMVAIGFLAGLYLLKFNLKKQNRDENLAYDLVFWAVISGILGARLFYWIQFGGNPFTIWEGGLVYYGGFVGGIIGLLIFTRVKGLGFWTTLDLIMPSLALGHAFGRIGCFFKGCCGGMEMQNVMPWALNHAGTLIHPTQIYSVFANLIVFAVLEFLILKNKTRGLITATYLIIYPIFRFTIEFFRAEPEIAFGLSIAQILSIGLFLAGAGLFGYIIYSKIQFEAGKKYIKGEKN